MPDRTQDLKNLRAVATACKGYVDKSIDNLKWELGTYDLGVESDNTSALVKTMPSGTIKANVNKIYGKSVKYNQLCPNGNFANTNNWDVTRCNLSVSNNIGTAISTSDGSAFRISFDFDKRLSHKYFLYLNVKSSSLDSFAINGTGVSDMPTTYSISNAFTSVYKFFQTFSQATITNIWLSSDGSSAIGNDLSFKDVQLFDLTDIFGSGNEPTDLATVKAQLLTLGINIDKYNPYSTGSIRNLELSGLKVEEQNLFDLTNTTSTKISVDTTTGNVTAFDSGYADGYINFDCKPYTDYYIKFSVVSYTVAYQVQIRNSDNTAIKDNVLSSTTFNSGNNTRLIIRFRSGTGGNVGTTVYGGVMIVRGTTEPASYVPHIAPTTIPIDLTSIEDSGGNKLFADGSIKGVGNVADEITPYKAIKRINMISNLGLITPSSISSTAGSSGGLYYADFHGILLANTNNVLSTIKYISNPNTAWTSTTPCLSNYPSATYGTVLRYFTTKSTSEDIMNDLSGVPLLYETNPIEADIDLSQLKNIQGYSNGSITAQNTYDMAVSSEIDYLVEEVKA